MRHSELERRVWILRLDRFVSQQLSSLDSGFARDAFSTFIPIGVDSPARLQIIKDFFDLLASVAAHGKVNGLGGHKVSRYAGWWAFDHYDVGKGFESGYQSWSKYFRPHQPLRVPNC